MSLTECPVTCDATTKIDSIVSALEKALPEYADEVDLIKWYMYGDVSIGCYGKKWSCYVNGFNNKVSHTLCTPPNSIIEYRVNGFDNKVNVYGGWGRMKMIVSGFDNVVKVRDYNLTHTISGNRNELTKLESASNGPDENCKPVNAQCSAQEEFWTDALDSIRPFAKVGGQNQCSAWAY